MIGYFFFFSFFFFLLFFLFFSFFFCLFDLGREVSLSTYDEYYEKSCCADLLSWRGRGKGMYIYIFIYVRDLSHVLALSFFVFFF